MPIVPEPLDTSDWPPAIWSYMQNRQGIVWNLHAPDKDSETGFCECWPAQVSDYREDCGRIFLGTVAGDQDPPVYGEVVPLEYGWSEGSPLQLMEVVLEHPRQLPEPRADGPEHRQHQRDVLSTVFDLLETLAALDGETVDEHVRAQRFLLLAGLPG
jgi:hypothetical protein